MTTVIEGRFPKRLQQPQAQPQLSAEATPALEETAAISPKLGYSGKLLQWRELVADRWRDYARTGAGVVGFFLSGVTTFCFMLWLAVALATMWPALVELPVIVATGVTGVLCLLFASHLPNKRQLKNSKPASSHVPESEQASQPPNSAA